MFPQSVLRAAIRDAKRLSFNESISIASTLPQRIESNQSMQKKQHQSLSESKSIGQIKQNSIPFGAMQEGSISNQTTYLHKNSDMSAYAEWQRIKQVRMCLKSSRKSHY